MEENILTVSGLKVEFDKRIILKEIGFSVKKDETVAVIGPNGAGKTVLFKALLGLIPYSGKVSWQKGTRLGYVPQKLAVAKDIPLTVEEFMKFKDASNEKIHEVLEAVGFQSKSLKTRLGDLSGGEMQRVLIAYALLGEPNVLLFDEPTAGVDAGGEETIYSLIHKLQEKEDLTIVFISHELQVVYKYADDVLCLNKEKISFGPPVKVIDKKTLAKLYGEEVNLHVHGH